MVTPNEAYRIRAQMIPLHAGIHCLKYVGRSGTEAESFFLVTIFPQDAEYVDQLTSATGVGAGLNRPGDVLIIRARQAVRIMVNTVSIGSRTTAALKIDKLDGLDDADADRARTEQPPTARVEVIT